MTDKLSVSEIKMAPAELREKLMRMGPQQLLVVFARAISVAAEDMDKLMYENRALRMQVECLVADAKHVDEKGYHPNLTKHPGVH